jgi:hypothetical protein
MTINECGPRVGFGIVADALDTTLTVASDPIVLLRFLVCNDKQVFTTAIKAIVVTKYRFLVFARRHQETVQIKQREPCGVGPRSLG